MKRLLIVPLAAAAVVIPAGGAAAKSCPSYDTPATINGQQKCLGRGEYCSTRYQSQYHRYHFNCQPVNGVYRLEPR